MKATAAIASALESLQRIVLGELPTPMRRAEALGKALGGATIWFKQDDLTGFGLGGNKVRSLEYLAAAAAGQRADCLVTGGRMHSNHVRITLATAAALGIPGTAVLMGEPSSDRSTGNVLLDEILGGRLVSIPPGPTTAIDERIEDEANKLRAAGHNPYVIGRGGASALGSAGYVRAALEILEQCSKLGIGPSALYCATGSCATQAGLLAGFRAAGIRWPVRGITVSRPRDECIARQRKLVRETADLLGILAPLSEEDPEIYDEHIGGGYGIPTQEAQDAIRLVAQTEGILLDPVYTGKAMAAMIEHIRDGKIRASETVLFLHTGGWPNLFAAHDDRGPGRCS